MIRALVKDFFYEYDHNDRRGRPSPSQVHELIVLPFIQQSAAMRVGTVTQISSHSLHQG